MQQFLAMILRGLNLGSKFIVFFVLAKYAEPEQVTIFGIYWISVVTISALMGLELYGHTIRSFLSESEIVKKRQIVGRHFGGLIFMNSIIMPLLISLIYFNLESLSPFLPIFTLHLLSEIIAHDNSRLLIGLGKPFHSILLNTVRGALWAMIALAYILFQKEGLDLTVIIAIWCGFSFSSLILSLFIIKSSLHSFPKPEIDLGWINSAIRVSFVLIFCALALRALVSGDKYLAELLSGANEAAYYIFYSTISFSVAGLIESGVSAWYYPKLVDQLKKGFIGDFIKTRKEFFFRNIISSIVLSSVVLLVSYFSVMYFLDEMYANNFNLLVFCIVGVTVYSCSMPDHYTLYGMGRDKVVLAINVFAALFFFSASLFLYDLIGSIGLAASFMSALILIAGARRAAVYYLLTLRL